MRPVLFFFVFLYFGNTISAQFSEKTKFQSLDFKQVKDSIRIQYELINAQQGTKYYVVVEVHAANGSKIPARNFTGDNEWVEGNGLKEIVWKNIEDSIFLDEPIFVKLIVSKLPICNSKKALLYTLALPGFGLTEAGAKKNQIWWGISAYTTVGVSCMFDYLALNAVQQYKAELNTAQGDQYMNQAHKFWSLSLITAGLAASIWAWNTYNVHKTIKKMQVPIPRNMKSDPDYQHFSCKSPTHLP